ncbi:MAG TPA: 3-hydroxyacyl-CoA dehydrogenase NAD-binding domain-containing protein [Chitinophagaceae bacterium]|nr:3-hydroxyacyl-CoA dehydrogenase NAD-binding domain-containing protein [Chitinophagaceae bacterium]
MQIGIIGSGTMGAGIAQVAAQAGNRVIVCDTNQTVLDKAKLNLENSMNKLVDKEKITKEKASEIIGNIEWTMDKTSLHQTELVIEAIVERLDIKQTLFTELETIVSPTCILASNTSSLSITSIASACAQPERVIGVHFFNPAPILELVEIVPALQTQESIVTQTKNIIDSWRKKTVIAKDTPGFIVNRIARPFYSEAIRIYEEGIASIETIDHAMKTIGGFKMGPFELMDLIGHDINYTVTETVWSAFYYDPRYTPSFTQKRLVEAKWFGRKSGKGFYNYAEGSVRNEPNTNDILMNEICWRVVVMLINEAANALYLQVASKEDIDLAMIKGVNYPKGLLAWADEKGIAQCVETLDKLYNTYREDRYRCSVLLRKMKEDQLAFYK